MLMDRLLIALAAGATLFLTVGAIWSFKRILDNEAAIRAHYQTCMKTPPKVEDPEMECLGRAKYALTRENELKDYR